MAHNEKNIQMAKQIAECVREVGGSTYYVGGYVRDTVLGRDSKDIDIEIHGVTPGELMAIFREKLGFYSCTVPSFQQYTLARFIERGHFEKHINRMRKFYRSRRNQVLDALLAAPFANRLTVLEEDAGLHFLLKADTKMTDKELTEWCEQAGFRVQALSEFYHGDVPASAKQQLVINYSGLSDKDVETLEQKLKMS